MFDFKSVLWSIFLKIEKVKKIQKWVAKYFSNEYNHAMISPNSVSYLRCHKKMTLATKSFVEKFNGGIHSGKVAALFSNVDQQFQVEIVGMESSYRFKEKKFRCWLRIQVFLYAIQWNGDAHMVNLFRVDAWSWLAYEHFCDVIPKGVKA